MLGSKCTLFIIGLFCLHMQTIEKEEGIREVRQLSQFLSRGSRLGVQRFQRQSSCLFPCPCFLGHKRFLYIRARGCRIMSLVSCIWGSLQTGHDGVLSLRMIRNRLSGDNGIYYCTKLQATPGAGQPFNVLRQRALILDFKEGKVP